MLPHNRLWGRTLTSLSRRTILQQLPLAPTSQPHLSSPHALTSLSRRAILQQLPLALPLALTSLSRRTILQQLPPALTSTAAPGAD